jgi:predicted DCC family thiol-disulfide oxidoreductase YuxK
MKRDLVTGTGVRGTTDDVTVVYDGACPLCRSYVLHLRLRESAGSVRLIDARQDPLLVKTLRSKGCGLDAGMVVRIHERLYHGAAALNVLALMSSRSGWFNRLNYLVFRSRLLSTLLYPSMVFGRRILLQLLGKQPLAGEPP